MNPEPVNIGVIGCGNISAAYFKAARTFPVLNIVACADMNPAAAAKAAETWGVEALGVNELLARDDIAVVLNLTIPQAHAEVTLQGLDAGKHVHLEKPLALNRAEGKAVLDRAEANGLRVSCAPDTFLGAGLQTCRQLLDAGELGAVVAGTAFMMGPGHERWHPNPGFYYLEGGGPVFDMAPYYLTALTMLLGPVARVSASAKITHETRTVTSEPRRGETLKVEVPTHVAGVLDFVSGATVTLVMSFDVQSHSHTPIELYGEKGSLQVPDPNTFGGPVKLRKAGSDSWQAQNLINGYTDNMRGIGLADLALALQEDRPHRCHSSLAFHVLDVMQALHESSDSACHITVESRCERPAPLPPGISGGSLS